MEIIDQIYSVPQPVTTLQSRCTRGENVYGKDHKYGRLNVNCSRDASHFRKYWYHEKWIPRQKVHIFKQLQQEVIHLNSKIPVNCSNEKNNLELA